MTDSKSRRSLVISYREARGQAMLVAGLGWLAVIAFVTFGAGDRSVFGPVKWTDFAHFYTLGDVARTREANVLFDGRALHERQSTLVPASADDDFVPVYGPQTALLFAPLSLVPYVIAGGIWGLVTLTAYGWSMWLAWRPARDPLSDQNFVVAGALAFPPIWQLIIYGQTTAVLIVAFAAALWALERDRHVLAGLALSLISVKPQWGLALAAVAVLAGEWRLILGVLVGIAAQAVLVIAVLDVSVLNDYAAALWEIRNATTLLEPDAYKMHSLRALTHVLPVGLDWGLWAVLSVVVVAATLRVWRQRLAPLRARFGVFVIASALVSPHLTIYDATVLALPILWVGGWLMTRPHDSTWFWQRCYWLSLALLLPTARLLVVQASPILLAELFVRLTRTIVAESRLRVVDVGAVAR